MSKDMKIGGEGWTCNGVHIDPAAWRAAMGTRVVEAPVVTEGVSDAKPVAESAQVAKHEQALTGEIPVAQVSLSAIGMSKSTGTGRWGN